MIYNIINFLKMIFQPKYLNFGADIKNIKFNENTVIKEFKNKDKFFKTLNFYNFVITDNEQKMFPKIISYNINKKEIEMEYCGDLLSLYNLPSNWEKQLNDFRYFFLKNNICVLDFRFMPHTPLIINNLCIKKNNIFLVDLILYKKKNNSYINCHFDNLIFQIKLYKYFQNYIIILFILHLFFELKRYLYDINYKISLF